MLVLSRKKNEGFYIDDDTFVKVLSIKGNTIRLGIEAPKGKKILRQEIFEAENNGNTEGTKE
jgi:carbon storage regulator